MNYEQTSTLAVSEPRVSAAPAMTAFSQPARIRLLMTMFGLSLSDVCVGSGRAISKSQFHRILHGQPATALEKRAVSVGMLACLQKRCDSAFLFEEGAQP